MAPLNDLKELRQRFRTASLVGLNSLRAGDFDGVELAIRLERHILNRQQSLLREVVAAIGVPTRDAGGPVALQTDTTLRPGGQVSDRLASNLKKLRALKWRFDSVHQRGLEAVAARDYKSVRTAIRIQREIIAAQKELFATALETAVSDLASHERRNA